MASRKYLHVELASDRRLRMQNTQQQQQQGQQENDNNWGTWTAFLDAPGQRWASWTVPPGPAQTPADPPWKAPPTTPVAPKEPAHPPPTPTPKEPAPTPNTPRTKSRTPTEPNTASTARACMATRLQAKPAPFPPLAPAQPKQLPTQLYGLDGLEATESHQEAFCSDWVCDCFPTGCVPLLVNANRIKITKHSKAHQLQCHRTRDVWRTPEPLGCHRLDMVQRPAPQKTTAILISPVVTKPTEP